MNYYQILRVGAKSSQVEIDRAYQKLVKEAKFDTNVNRKEIETAYRVLSNPTKKAVYDASLAEDARQATVKLKKAKKKISLEQKVALLVLLLFVAGIFFYIRYGYLLKNFERGDILIYRATRKVVGKVVGEQDNHSFGKDKKDAYMIETPKGTVWIPKDQVKTTCEKQEGGK